MPKIELKNSKRHTTELEINGNDSMSGPDFWRALAIAANEKANEVEMTYDRAWKRLEED